MPRPPWPSAHPIPGAWSKDQPRAFEEALAQLQALYDCQVSQLTAEVARLRGELEGRDPQAAVSAQASQETRRTDSADACLPRKTACLGKLQEPGDARPSLADGMGRTEVGMAQELLGRPERRRSTWISMAQELRAAPLQAKAAKPGRVAVAYKNYNLAIGQQPAHGFQAVCQKLVEKQWFDIGMGFFIMANVICIGIETSLNRAGDQMPVAMDILEYCFLSMYILELAARFGAHGIFYALRRSNWIKFDVFLVLVGVVDVTVKLAPTGGTVQILDKVLIVRILRLVRLARVFRVMIKFHTLWMLIQGLLNSLSTLVWTAAMIFTLLYVFAVLGLELLHPDPAAGLNYNSTVTTHFSNLTRCMLALLQGISLDSFYVIYRPLVLARPLTILYFAPFMLIVPIALMSLVTALMVNCSLDQAAKDKEEQEERRQQKKNAMVELLKELFHELDVDGSGRIDLQEMLAAPQEVRALIFEIAELPNDPTKGSGRELQEVFEVMDFDGSGDVEVDEFCEGLVKIQDGQALETLRIMKQCTQMMDMMKTKASALPSHDQHPPTGDASEFRMTERVPSDVPSAV